MVSSSQLAHEYCQITWAPAFIWLFLNLNFKWDNKFNLQRMLILFSKMHRLMGERLSYSSMQSSLSEFNGLSIDTSTAHGLMEVLLPSFVHSMSSLLTVQILTLEEAQTVCLIYV